MRLALYHTGIMASKLRCRYLNLPFAVLVVIHFSLAQLEGKAPSRPRDMGFVKKQHLNNT